MGESEIRSEADASQAHDVSSIPQKDCSRSTCEMGEGQEGCLEGGAKMKIVVEEAVRAGYRLVQTYEFVKDDGMDYFLVFIIA